MVGILVLLMDAIIHTQCPQCGCVMRLAVPVPTDVAPIGSGLVDTNGRPLGGPGEIRETDAQGHYL